MNALSFDPPKPLHPSHHAVLEAIRAFIAKYSIAPAVRDIADAVHKSPNAVVESLSALERAGLIACPSRGGRRIARGILLIQKSTEQGKQQAAQQIAHPAEQQKGKKHAESR